MKEQEMVRKAREVVSPFRVVKGRKFRLADHDPGDTGPLRG